MSVHSLHALTAHVLPRADVELIAKIAGLDALMSKEERAAQRLCRQGFLRPKAGGYEPTFDARRVVDAYREAGWLV